MLSPGTKLGTCEVTAQIGAGGMGEVYRARDIKLGRDVAVKVLPQQFARDPERLARFQREAKMLAALNHANIAAIYGLEESAGTHYLVMELVDGATLAERIVSGPLPVAEALPIAKQIADAIEYAHDHNILHRDLKPANIKVRDDGTVKVLDFGLAKAMSEDAAVADIANSPTLSMAATRQGIILGTAAYMSPEQAKGKSVDRRTDVWAFGAVLFELLTGKQAFSGEDITDVLAAVVMKEPQYDALPSDTPPAIRTLLRRCLEKNIRRRLPHIAEARLIIEDILSGAAPSGELPAAQVARPHAFTPSAILIALGALLFGAAAATVIAWRVRPSTPQPISRLTAVLSPGDHVPLLNTNVVALSPDGSQIAFVSVHDGRQRIYLRSLAVAEATPLTGTEGAESLFFSPNGRWLGFFAAGKLMKASMDGGAPLPICDAASPRGVTWGDDDRIVFANNFGTSGLWEVPAAGGKPRPLTSKDPATAEEAHRWPQLLPGGQAVLFTAWSRNLDDSFIAVQRLDTKERRILVRGGTDARYLPSGHLVYARAGTLLIVPFDLSRLQVTGEAIPVALGDGVSLGTEGNAQFSMSQTGSLVYIPGGLQGSNRTLVLVDRRGNEQPIPAPPRNYATPRLSPDGQRIAVNISGVDDDVWIYDIPRQTLSRLTSGARSLSPVWMPDGRRVIYRSARAGALNLFWKPIDGTGDEERLTTSQANQTPQAVSPDGQWLIFRETSANTGMTILSLASSDRKSQPLIETTTFNARGPAFSPDGRWFAYTSDESGRDEIYVRPFPSGPGKWQVSTNGGTEAFWARTGELFYSEGDKTMTVQITTNSSVTVSQPQLLFEKSYLSQLGSPGMTLDGQRFLMLKAGEQEQNASQINVVLNWSEELKRRVPSDH